MVALSTGRPRLVSPLRRRQTGRCGATHLYHSERLELGPPHRRHADAFMSSIDEEVRRWHGYADSDIDTWRTALVLVTRRRQPPGCPRWLFAAERSSGAFAGSYKVHSVSKDGADAELGWWMAPGARGRGLGRESLAMVLDYIHDHLGIASVWMATDEANARAIAQIEAVGAVFEGLRPHELPNGSKVPSRWYLHAGGQAASPPSSAGTRGGEGRRGPG